RWPRRQRQRSGREGIGHPGIGQRPGNRVLDVDEKAPRRQVFIFEQIFHGVDRETRDTLLLSPAGNVVLGILPTPLTEQGPQRRSVLLSCLSGSVMRIAGPGRMPHDLQPAFPLRLLARGDRHIAVVAREYPTDGADHATNRRFLYLLEI